MNKSVINFHSNLIDYAGLFPPAKQEMSEAWRDFCFHRDSEYRWMLANFICPASRLDELNMYFGQTAGNEQAFPFSILGSRCDDADTFKSSLKRDMDSVSRFISSNIKNSVEINIYETHFPHSAILKGGQLEVLNLFHEADRAIATVLEPEGMIFYELPVIGADMHLIQTFVESISIYNESLKGDNHTNINCRCGFKLRCGGVSADAFPSVEGVAAIVALCQENGVPLKATAGLHHPLRHYSEDVNTKMHGFLNLIGAVVLAKCNKIELKQIKQIISDENSDSFVFSDESFGWREFVCNQDQIASARDLSFISYGSCSFVEPIDDLKALGIF